MNCTWRPFACCAPLITHPRSSRDGWPIALLRAVSGGIGAGATIVAELTSDIIGFGEGVPGGVVAVFVDPVFANRGIGSALLERTLHLAQNNQVTVRVESTLNAVGFYERFGFSQIERSVARRNQVEIPIVVMQRHAG